MSYFVLACWLTVVSFVQGAPAPDPITGQWGQDTTKLLDIVFDGKSAVTGTIFLVNDAGVVPAPVKEGSFDAATGAFKLTGEVKHPAKEQMLPYVIEGKLVKDVLEVNYTFGDDKGRAALKKLPPADAKK